MFSDWYDGLMICKCLNEILLSIWWINPENIKGHNNIRFQIILTFQHNLHRTASYWQSKQKKFGVITAIDCSIFPDKHFTNLDLSRAMFQNGSTDKAIWIDVLFGIGMIVFRKCLNEFLLSN